MNLVDQTLLTISRRCHLDLKAPKSSRETSSLLKKVFNELNSNREYLADEQLINAVKVLDQLTHENPMVHRWLDAALLFKQGDVFTIFVQGEPLYYSKSALSNVSDYVKGMKGFKSSDQTTLDDREVREVKISLKLALEGGEVPDVDLDVLWNCFETAQFLGLAKAETLIAESYVEKSFKKGKTPTEVQMKRMGHLLRRLKLRKSFNVNYTHLEKLKDLRIEHLDISDNGLTEQAFVIIGGMKHLKTLDLSDSNYLWDNSLRHLMNLSELTELNISGQNQIMDTKSVEMLARLPKLTQLILTDMVKISEETVKVLRAKPNLVVSF